MHGPVENVNGRLTLGARIVYMRVTWCFRCGKDVPMVDEREWNPLWNQVDDAAVLNEYEQIAGNRYRVGRKRSAFDPP